MVMMLTLSATSSVAKRFLFAVLVCVETQFGFVAPAYADGAAVYRSTTGSFIEISIPLPQEAPKTISSILVRKDINRLTSEKLGNKNRRGGYSISTLRKLFQQAIDSSTKPSGGGGGGGNQK